MSDAPRNEIDAELSAAYRTLVQRRASLTEQQEAIGRELERLDTALQAMSGIAGIKAEGIADAVGVEAETAPAKTEPEPAPKTEEAAADREPEAAPEESKAAPATGRKIRTIEVLLENSGKWLTIAEIADFVEGRTATAGERNTSSETLRRMLRHGNVQRDDKNRPVRYKGVAAKLREILRDAD